jgi:hypothetical protein
MKTVSCFRVCDGGGLLGVVFVGHQGPGGVGRGGRGHIGGLVDVPDPRSGEAPSGGSIMRSDAWRVWQPRREAHSSREETPVKEGATPTKKKGEIAAHHEPEDAGGRPEQVLTRPPQEGGFLFPYVFEGGAGQPFFFPARSDSDIPKTTRSGFPSCISAIAARVRARDTRCRGARVARPRIIARASTRSLRGEGRR